MKKNNKTHFLYILIFLFVVKQTFSQQKIDSKVYDIETKKPVSDVAIQIENTNKWFVTDANGTFKIEDLEKHSFLIFSKIGYKKLKIALKDIEERIYLIPKVSRLKEVKILSRTFSSSQLKKVVSDQIYLSKKDIEQLPFILGEKDVIKLIQYTPGVQQGTEGQSGLLVRGGNGSMNLTLLDNIYLHNISHLGGLFSSINSDFVQSLEFSKSGFDAEFGGRLSSVTDIKTLSVSDSTQFKGSIGLLTSKLSSNIKINSKNNLLLSGRRTYLEIFKPFLKPDNSLLSSKKNYLLYDFLIKHSLEISDKNSLETTFYKTKDKFTDKTKGRNSSFIWGNTIIGTTFKHKFSDYLQSETTLFNSFYNLSLNNDDAFLFNYSAKSSFGIYGLKHHFLWNKPSKYIVKFGGQYNRNKILPKDVKAKINNTPLEILNQETYFYEDINVFADIEIPINLKLAVKTGVRATTYINQKNELINREIFYALEPRLSLKYKLSNNQVFKASYQRLSQFVHQASVNSFNSPTDFFIVSTGNVKPQVVNQFSIGHVFEQGTVQLESAVFYKDVNGFTDFENGSANNLLSNNIYDDILVGKLKSYGLEFSVNKKIKKLTSQLALTLSKTRAKFDRINNGNYYPTIFDRPINFNSINHYKLNDMLEFGALFLFTSGQNYTRPKDIRILNQQPILNFESKNASRYPNYHRLDLSCTYTFKQKRKLNSKLNFTIYNIYNNKNPFFISSALWGDVEESYIQITDNIDNLFPILPTVNLMFSF